jgi:hypothetical protein
VATQSGFTRNTLLPDKGLKTYIPQLDLLRGIAIVLMVVNHAGVRLLDPHEQQEGLLGALIFCGSFAPVLFFFTTGFGSGISKRRVDFARFRSTFIKAVLLLLADQYMFWVNGVPLGLDFLGFIALSSVIVSAVAACRSPRAVCIIVIALALFMRFGIGPWLQAHTQVPGVVEWLISVRPIDRISYPFSPWIIYPMLGFLAARRYIMDVDTGNSYLWLCVGALGMFSLALALALYDLHAVFFRWGTMSAAYFVLSLAVISISALCAWVFGSDGSISTRLLSLRGIASLAVVPIHFALIEALVSFKIVPLSTAMEFICIGLLIAGSVVLARIFTVAINRLISRPDNTSHKLAYALATSVVLSAAAIWLVPLVFVAFAAMVVGQLAITGLMAVRDHSREFVAGASAAKILAS